MDTITTLGPPMDPMAASFQYAEMMEGSYHLNINGEHAFTIRGEWMSNALIERHPPFNGHWLVTIDIKGFSGGPIMSLIPKGQHYTPWDLKRSAEAIMGMVIRGSGLVVAATTVAQALVILAQQKCRGHEVFNPCDDDLFTGYRYPTHGRCDESPDSCWSSCRHGFSFWLWVSKGRCQTIGTKGA